MSSLKELTEDATTDRQDRRARMAHLKTYTFFVFYQPSTLAPIHPVLQVSHSKCRRCSLNSRTRRTAKRQIAIEWCSCSSTAWRKRANARRVCWI
jgi:hypothetical protein